MARSVSDEELQLKKRARRRLIGAVVLVTTVAVVLPMVLDSEPRPSDPSISIQIPAQDAGVIAKSPSPLKPVPPLIATAPADGKSETVAEAAPPAARVEPKPQPAAKAASADSRAPAESPAEALGKGQAAPAAAETRAAESKPAAAAETASAAARPAPAKPAEAKPADGKSARSEPAQAREAEKNKAAGGYVIQVAALADAAKAKELQAKLAGAGLKVLTEQVQTARGPVTRVRVGPYPSREAAEKARPQLQKLQLDGKVVPR